MNSIARAKSPPSRIGSFFVVVAIFVGLGPIVGGLSVWIFASAGRVVNMGISNNDPVGYLSVLALIFLFAHLIGLLYALIAGVIVAWAGIFRRWNNVVIPVIASVIASLIGSQIPLLYSWLASGKTNPFGIFPVCLIAALVCWFLTRGIVRATWQSAN